MTAQNISLISLAVFSVIVLLFALMVLWKIFTDEISLRGLLAEPADPPVALVTEPAAAAVAPAAVVVDPAGVGGPAPGAAKKTVVAVKTPLYGKASLSRFQFLIFTFVIAGLYLLLSIEAGTFVDIPTNVLGLLGISGGSFLVSKGMSTSSQKKKVDDANG
jgi:hypothetical protein